MLTTEETFFQPWSEIPGPQRGADVDSAVESEFVAPRVTSMPRSNNSDLIEIHSVLNQAAAHIAAQGGADIQGPPRQDFVAEALKALDFSIDIIRDRTVLMATSTRKWTHAVPPMLRFQAWPVRFPLANTAASTLVFNLIGAAVEASRSIANGYHQGIDVTESHQVARPVIASKARLIKDLFGVEVAGEISFDEYKELFGTVPPDQTGTSADRPRPDQAAVAEVLRGTDVVLWRPTDVDWVKFAEMREKRFRPVSLFTPRTAFTDTSLSLVPETPLDAAGARYGTDARGGSLEKAAPSTGESAGESASGNLIS